MAAGGKRRTPDTLGHASTIDSGPAHRDTIPLTPRIGEVLGERYELLELLGRGAFGAVFRARDRVAAEIVALKLLALDRRIAGQLDRLRRELRAARKVTHPGVVRLYDLVEIGDQVALSMELVAGETLEKRLSSGPLDAGAWRSLGRELAEALAAAHEAGVTHRDLKPANILLRAGSRRAVITDFGVSRLAGAAEALDSGATLASDAASLTHEGAIVGTPLYMAPEQLAGRPVGPAADVYALGAVLYEAAAGRLPHRAETIAALVEARAEPAPPLASLRPDLPAALCALVDRMLAREPSERPALSDLTRGDEPAIRTASPAPRRRRRAAIVVAAVTAIVGAAALSAGLLGRSEPGSRATGPLRLAIVAESADGDDGLVPSVSRMARRRLADDLRIVPVDDVRSADATLSVVFRRTGDGIELSLDADLDGRHHDVGTFTAASVAGALDAAADAVGALAAGRPPRGPTPAEQERMALLGTESFEAYRAFAAGEIAEFATVTTDAAEIVRRLEEAVRADPRWVHPYLGLAFEKGLIGDAALEVIGRARVAADPAADPRGWVLLDVVEAFNRGDHARATELATSVADPRDVFGARLLQAAYFFQDDVQEQLAWARRLHELRPDLQFGYDLTTVLYQAGRGEEVPAVIARWREQAPDSEQALASAAKLAAAEGRWADAEARASELLLLFGREPHRLVLYCDTLIAAGKLVDARAIADRLLLGDAVPRARGLYRVGVIATLEGRFGAAYESLKEALDANLPLAINGEITQTLEALQGIAWVGAPGDLARWTEELARAYDGFGAAGAGAAARYERSLLDPARRACPDLEALVAAVPEGRQRSRARVEMLRAAADAGCAPCADVVSAGLAFRETSARSLLRFARCAEQERALDLAIRAYDDVIARSNNYGTGIGIDAPYEWMLAVHHRARLAERTGDAAGARARYQLIVDRWGKADRRVDEVLRAREALERLAP